MTITVANVYTTNTFEFWRQQTNKALDAISTKVVTAASNSTTGNVVVNGSVQSITLVVNAIAGSATMVANGDGALGTAATLYFTTNTQFRSNLYVNTATFSVGNASVNTTINTIAIATTATLAAGNTTITGYANVSANVNIAGNANVAGEVNVGANFKINTTAVTTTSTVASGNTVITGTLGANNTTISGTLAAGNTTVTGIMNTVGNAAVSGTGVVMSIGNSTVNSVINSTGIATVGTFVLGNTSTGNLTVGAASITTGGNVSGTWVGTAISVTKGGTGLSVAPSAGQILIANGSGYTTNTLAAGAGISIANTSTSITITNAGVRTFNSRTADVTLSQADVVTALGFFPAGTSTNVWGSYGDDVAYSAGNTAVGFSPGVIGTGASLTPVFSANSLISVTVNAGGSGYINGTPLSIVSATGSAASARVVTNGVGSITSITVVGGGADYNPGTTTVSVASSSANNKLHARTSNNAAIAMFENDDAAGNTVSYHANVDFKTANTGSTINLRFTRGSQVGYGGITYGDADVLSLIANNAVRLTINSSALATSNRLATGNIAVTGVITSTGNVSVGGNASVTGTLTVSGTVVNSSAIALAGVATVTGNVTASDTITGAGLVISGQANVTANVNLGSASNVKVGNTKISATEVRADSLFSNNTLEVARASTLTGNVSVGANLTVSGTTNVVALNASGLVSVTANATFSGSKLTVNTSTLDVVPVSITLAKGAATAADANTAGIIVDTVGAYLRYNNALTAWQINQDLIPAANNVSQLGYGTFRWGFVNSNNFVGTTGTITTIDSTTVNATTLNANVVATVISTTNVTATRVITTNVTATTITGNITGTTATMTTVTATNLAGTLTTASQPNITANNSTNFNGQAASYYVDIPARLGYTPVNKTGDSMTGALTINSAGPQITLSNSTSNFVNFSATGSAVPAVTTRSVGSKLVLFNTLSSTSTDYAIGIQSGAMWLSVGAASAAFRFYSNTTNHTTLTQTSFTTSANLYVSGANAQFDGTVNAAAVTTGSVYSGGAIQAVNDISGNNIGASVGVVAGSYVGVGSNVALSTSYLTFSDSNTAIIGIGNTTASGSNTGLIINKTITANRTAVGLINSLVVSNGETVSASTDKFGIYNGVEHHSSDANNRSIYANYTLATLGSAVSVGTTANAVSLYGNYTIARNYAASVLPVAVGSRADVAVYGTGNITTAIGMWGYITSGNSTVTGDMDTAYGVRSSIVSNTSSSITTGYLVHGAYTGSNFTTKWGVYVSGEEKSYFSGNVGIKQVAPSYTLDVDGDINATGALRVNGVSIGTRNRAYAETSTPATISTVIPHDNTVPQSGEGTQILSAAFTPSSGTARVRIQVVVPVSQIGTEDYAIAGLFKGTTCIASTAVGYRGINTLTLNYEHVPGSGSTTYSVRVGKPSGGQDFNICRSFTGTLGSTMVASLIVEEVAS